MESKYTKEILEPIVINSTTMAQVLKKLGLSISGGNHSNIKRVLLKLDISTSHFVGQSWNKGKTFEKNRKNPESYLILYSKDNPINSDRIKKWMFRDGVKEKKCENCGIISWNGKEAPLEIHHLDGNRWNNVITNILILCPNCHAQT